MKVYRYLSQVELDYILEGNIELIGTEYDNDIFKDINSHRYKKGVKYLHFYKNKKDIRHIQRMNKATTRLDYYICEFDIPLLVIMQGWGYGKYNSYRRSVPFEQVVEFKMPATKLKPDYLKSYTLDENHHVTVEEWEAMLKTFTR